MENREYVYDGYLKVEKIEDTIKGKQVVRERLTVDDAVAGVLVDAKGRYGLVKQYRPTVGRYTYELVAGTCDKELSKQQTLIEELEEECEISRNDIFYMKKLHEYFVMVGISDTLMTLYTITVKEQESKQVNDADVEEVIWVTYEEFTDMVNEGKIVDSKTLLGYYMVAKNKQEKYGEC